MHSRIPAENNGFSAGSLSSMIDIVFLLIIFFVVTASVDREQIDSQVSLPVVDSAAIKSLPPERIMVNILSDGSVKLGFQHISADEVPGKLGSLLRSMKADRKTVLIINGHRATPHKFISGVMNSAAKAGYDQVRINAEVKAESR